MTEITDLGECDIVLPRQQPDLVVQGPEPPPLFQSNGSLLVASPAGNKLVRQAELAAANARSRFENARSEAIAASPTSAEGAVLTIHWLKQQSETIQAELNATIAAIKAEMRQLHRLADRMRRH